MPRAATAPLVRWAIDLGRMFGLRVDLETKDGCARHGAVLRDIEWTRTRIAGVDVALPDQLCFGADDWIPMVRLRVVEASGGPAARPRFRWVIDLGDLIEKRVDFDTREGFSRRALRLVSVRFEPVRLFGRELGVPAEFRFADEARVPFRAMARLDPASEPGRDSGPAATVGETGTPPAGEGDAGEPAGETA